MLGKFCHIMQGLWYHLRPILLSLKAFIIKKSKQHPGMTSSLGLHFVLFICVFGSLSWFNSDKPDEPKKQIIKVDLLPIKDITNAKPQKKIIKKTTKHTPVKSIRSKPKPPPPPKKKKVSPKKEVIKKPIKKVAKKPKKTPKKKSKPPKDFNSVMKNIAALKEKPNQKQISAKHDITKPLSASQRDAIISRIRNHIESTWSPTTALGASNMTVTLYFRLDRNGKINNIKVVNESEFKNNSAFQALADSAKRAAYRASPLKDLPANFYSDWEEVEMNFDPSNLF